MKINQSLISAYIRYFNLIKLALRNKQFLFYFTDINTLQNEMSPKVELKVTNPRNSPKHFPFNQTPRTTCPNKILDISALKQQPKLL